MPSHPLLRPLNTTGLTVATTTSSISSSRRRILAWAVLSRLVVLAGMIVSSALLPDFYPGDDVLQFDLRLSNSSSFSRLEIRQNNSWSHHEKKENHKHEAGEARGETQYCFCLAGHACDKQKQSGGRVSLSSNLGIKARHSNYHNRHCADHDDSSLGVPSNSTWSSITLGIRLPYYQYLLTPLTRWDAARFLTLAVDPMARYPPLVVNDDLTNEDFSIDQSKTYANTTETSTKDGICLDLQTESNIKYDDLFFVTSEQAHAFFPLLPLCIRYVAVVLVWSVPSILLPPTFEAVVVLAALCVNLLSFTLAAMALHDATYTLTIRQIQANRTVRNDDMRETNHHTSACLYLAEIVTLFFCFNPASVFFSTAYSESLFAMLTFTGHALAARGRFLPASTIWALASYTRSNGTVSSIWLLLVGIARIVSVVIIEMRCSSSSKKHGTLFWRTMIQILSIMSRHVFFAAIVTLPVLYHDWRGYNIHCVHNPPPPSYALIKGIRVVPTWCNGSTYKNNSDDDDNYFQSLSFSLYGYVQRKHWNVGFLRYYQIKQLPNFLLALPILFLGFKASIDWIWCSWDRFLNEKKREKKTKTKEQMMKKLDDVRLDNVGMKPPSVHDTARWYGLTSFFDIIHWMVFALDASNFLKSLPTNSNSTQTADEKRTDERHDKAANQNYDNELDRNYYISLLIGNYTLSYYAILAGLCIIGSTLAHVQISTRLICSSSPAVYWYMARLVLNENKSTRCSEEKRKSANMVLLVYCLAYIVLGIVMHVNWLPWT